MDLFASAGARFLAALSYLAAGAVAVLGLWRFWTPRCNEACPSWLVVTTFSMVTLLATYTVFIAASIVLGKLGRTQSFLGFMALLAVTGSVTLILFRVVHA